MISYGDDIFKSNVADYDDDDDNEQASPKLT